MNDDEQQKIVQGYVIGSELNSLSIEELEKLVKALQDEATRIKDEINHKKQVSQAAQNIFRV